MNWDIWGIMLGFIGSAIIAGLLVYLTLRWQRSRKELSYRVEMNTSRVNEELDAIDAGVRARSLKEAHEGFALFAEAMGLFHNLILSYTHFSVKTSDEGRRAALGAHRLLMIDAFNSLRAAYKLLIDGYYAQVSLLLRRVVECILRMWFFVEFPEEALLYWENSDAWRERYPSEASLRKKLTQHEEVDWLRERYHMLSHLAHASAKAIIPQVASVEEKQVVGVISGAFNQTWLRVFQSQLVEVAGVVLHASAEPTYALLREHEPTWLEDFDKFKLAASKFVKETKAEVERQGE